MVSTINPADCKPGEVYEGRVHGLERTVLVRRDSADSYPWESLSEVLDHEDVSELVRLVPARPVTRQDLPDIYAAYSKVMRQDCGDLTPSDMGPVLDAVVERLNANGGVPVSREDAALADRLERQAASIARLQGELENAERDRSRWRLAHGIVEQERITARQQFAEAVARAEAAERERDEAKQAYCDLYDGDVAKVAEWKARAEAAEARTAPAVTKAEVAAVIDYEWYPRGDQGPDTCIDRVWSLVSGPDPAVFVVRESDVAAVEVSRDGAEGDFETPRLGAFKDDNPAHVAAAILSELERVAEREALRRAIEAGQATDPVENKARELWEVARFEDGDDWSGLLQVERDCYRRMARHVLGQEAKR